MLYNLQIEVEKKPAKVQFNLELPEPIVREFKYVAKQCGMSSTKVVMQMLSQFIEEYRSKGQPTQRSMF